MSDFFTDSGNNNEAIPRYLPMQPPQNVYIQAPVNTPPVTSGYSYTWLYICLGIVILLLTYIAVEYSKDVKNRDTRNKRYNLDAFVEYSMAKANRLPHGHVTKKRDIAIVEEEENSSYEEEEEDIYMNK